MNGIIVVDKPAGMTSHDVVETIRRMARGLRVGHAGTLDPNATGILIILVGRATKVSRFLMALEKEYLFTLKLGLETDTLDRWGKTLRETDVADVREEEILNAASRFTGRYQQVAPSVSALKHKGVRLYELARRGEPVPVKTRLVTISSFDVIEITHPYVTIRIVCSSGTYVRSLARDMGRQLGCGASVYKLRRLRVGRFGVEDAWTLDEIAEGGRLEDRILSIEEGLEHLPRIRIGDDAVERLRMGAQPRGEDICPSELDFEGPYGTLTDGAGRIVAIVSRRDEDGHELRIERVI